METPQQQPTQAISPGSNPFAPKSAGRSDPMMVDPAAAAAEFTVGLDRLQQEGTTLTNHDPAKTASQIAENTSALITLGSQGQTVADPAEDIRGRKVHDEDGNEIGKVTDLLIDTDERKVRFLKMEHGGFLGLGARASFLPVDAISAVSADVVTIGQSGGRVAAAPTYDPELQNEKSYYEHLSGYYGYQPYWGMGYIYPGYPHYDAAPYLRGRAFHPGD